MDFAGRVDRRGYIIAQLVVIPLTNLGLSAFALAMWNINRDFPTDLIPQIVRGTELARPTAWSILVVASIASCLAIITNLSFTIRRLHDLDFSGWFMFLWPIWMLINFAFANDKANVGANTFAYVAAFDAVLTMVPGVPGANIYGASLRPAVREGP